MLFVLRPALGTAHFTLPRVQIVVGVVLLINAVAVAAGLVGNRGDGSAGLTSRRFEPLATRTRRLLNGRSLWTAGIAGLGIALPSVDYLAVLALIVASGAAASVQFGALLLFNAVACSAVSAEPGAIPNGVGAQGVRRLPPGPFDEGRRSGLLHRVLIGVQPVRFTRSVQLRGGQCGARSPRRRRHAPISLREA